MKLFEFSKAALLALPLSFALQSCQTTGDPNDGGYWGYSRAKNKVRQDDLRSELDMSNDRGDDLQAQNRSLQSRKSDLQKELASATTRSRNASTPAEKQQADNRVADLNKQLRKLEAL